eukprot:11156132-Prorocentrum_lima.AAC.1
MFNQRISHRYCGHLPWRITSPLALGQTLLDRNKAEGLNRQALDKRCEECVARLPSVAQTEGTSFQGL